MEYKNPAHEPQPLSFRQKEFARHYASGRSPQDAARMAGYSPSTIDTDAQKLLSSKRIAALVERHRGAGTLVGRRHLRLRIESLERILASEPDANKAIRAGRILISLYQSQVKQGLSLADEPAHADASSHHPSLAAPTDFPTVIQFKTLIMKQL